MLRLRGLSTKVLNRNGKPCNFSSVNKNKSSIPPQKPNESVIETAFAKPYIGGNPPPKSGSTVGVIGAALLSGVVIVLVINANNPEFSAQIDKHAPWLNPVLQPFRPRKLLEPVDKPADVASVPTALIKTTTPEVVQNHTEIESESESQEETIHRTTESAPAHVEDSKHVQVEEESKPEEKEIVAVVEEIVVVDVPELPFSAAEEVHDLEVKYEEVLHPTHSHTSSVDSSVAKSHAAAEGNTLLHYELQNQARVILSELQSELHRQKEREMDERHQRELHHALSTQAAELEAKRMHDLEAQAKVIATTLQDELNHQVAVLRKSQVDELLVLQPKVDGLKADLRTFEVVANETAAAVKQTLDTHHISSAVLRLELFLSNNHGQPVGSLFEDLRKDCANDPLVLSVLDGLPKSVLQYGALNDRELHIRFEVMRNEVRKVALAPEEAPKMVGQFIGNLLAKLTWAPKGFLTGQGVEDVLARADWLLERGRIKDALTELEQVEGYSQLLMSDFKKLALDRLVLDQSIAVLKAKSVLRHKSFTK